MRRPTARLKGKSEPLRRAMTNRRVRRYLPLCGSRYHWAGSVINLGFFAGCGKYDSAG